MPLCAADQVAFGIVVEADGAESHALVKRHMVGDHAGLSDHDARAMIDEETRPDSRSRMNVDASAAVRPLRHHSRNQRDAKRMQAVRQAIDGDRFEPRIAKDNFVVPMGGRVALECRLNVRGDDDAQLWEVLQKG